MCGSSTRVEDACHLRGRYHHLGREEASERSDSQVLETRADNARRAHFSVTKLRLPCTLLFQEECDAEYDRRALNFQLDPESRKVAVQRCSGRWVVERANGLTRISLEACIKATRYVPGVAVDYVAEKALGRATAWIPRSGRV